MAKGKHPGDALDVTDDDIAILDALWKKRAEENEAEVKRRLAGKKPRPRDSREDEALVARRAARLGKGKAGDRLPGGKAAGASDAEFDPEQLAAGAKVEMEHTRDPKVAREIARDHLKEDKDYYRKLRKMEAHSRADPPLVPTVDALAYQGTPPTVKDPAAPKKPAAAKPAAAKPATPPPGMPHPVVPPHAAGGPGGGVTPHAAGGVTPPHGWADPTGVAGPRASSVPQRLATPAGGTAAPVAASGSIPGALATPAGGTAAPRAEAAAGLSPGSKAPTVKGAAVPGAAIPISHPLPRSAEPHTAKPPPERKPWQEPFDEAGLHGHTATRRPSDSQNPTWTLHPPPETFLEHAWGTKPTHFAKIPHDYFSGAYQPSQVGTEIAAHDILHLAGVPHVPHIGFREQSDGKHQLITPLVPPSPSGHKSLWHAHDKGYLPALRKANHPDDVARMLVGNWLINAQDRHAGNYIIGPNDEVVPIDYGVAFHSHPDTIGIPLKHDALHLLVPPDHPLDKGQLQNILDRWPDIQSNIDEVLRYYPGPNGDKMKEVMARKPEQIKKLLAMPRPLVSDLRADPESWKGHRWA